MWENKSILTLKAINELNLANFRQDRLSITGFSIVDYKNYKVAKQIGDTVQTSVPFNKITPIPVRNLFLFEIMIIII